MNNSCSILSKVQKRRLNRREWKNMTANHRVQASARDPGLRSPGRQKSRENHENHGKMLTLGVHLNHSMVRSTHRATDKLAFKLAYQNEKKEHMIHINTYQYISIHIMHPRKYRKKAVLAQSLRHKSLGTLLRNPNERGQHHRLQKENVTNHSRTTQSPGQKDHCLHYYGIFS